MANKTSEMDAQLNVTEKLLHVQTKLKAPKNQRNSFGEYNYRSCEDILEAVKPLLKEVGATIVLSDDIVMLGDRFYIKATAKFIDIVSNNHIENTAFAREVLEKKKSDPSQCTGAASSYARKFCLNGLLLIDDTRDADSEDHYEEARSVSSPAQDNTPITQSDMEHLKSILKEHGWDQSVLLDYYHLEGLSQMTKTQYAHFVAKSQKGAKK